MTFIKNAWHLIGRILDVAIIAFAIAYVVHAIVETPSRDDIDQPAPGHYSKLSLLIDYGTGCEYVSTAFSGPSPRYGRDGKQICRDH